MLYGQVDEKTLTLINKLMSELKENLFDSKPCKELYEKIYYMLKKIRLVEERIAEEYPKQEIRCPYSFINWSGGCTCSIINFN